MYNIIYSINIYKYFKNHHIYEFGAGLGLLAKQLLDFLQKLNKPLYQETQLSLIDSSQSLMDQIQDLGILNAHQHHIHYENESILSFTEFADSGFNFIYLTYIQFNKTL